MLYWVLLFLVLGLADSYCTCNTCKDCSLTIQNVCTVVIDLPFPNTTQAAISTVCLESENLAVYKQKNIPSRTCTCPDDDPCSRQCSGCPDCVCSVSTLCDFLEFRSISFETIYPAVHGICQSVRQVSSAQHISVHL